MVHVGLDYVAHITLDRWVQCLCPRCLVALRLQSATLKSRNTTPDANVWTNHRKPNHPPRSTTNCTMSANGTVTKRRVAYFYDCTLDLLIPRPGMYIPASIGRVHDVVITTHGGRGH
jgi:hypothetical protein